MNLKLRIVITFLFVPLFFTSVYGYEIVENKLLEFQAYTDEVSTLFYSVDTTILYTRGRDKSPTDTPHTDYSIKSWNPLSGQFLGTVYAGSLCDYSADGQRMLIRTKPEEGAILLDISTKSVLHTFSHSYLLYNARFSADENQVFTCGAVLPEGQEGSFAEIKIWDCDTGELLDTKSKGPIIVNNEEIILRYCSSIDVSPNGRYIYALYGYWYEYYPGVQVVMGYDELIDLSDWQVMRIYGPGDRAHFSPDEKHWAVGEKIFDLGTHLRVGSFEGAEALFDYSPNGKYMLGKSSISDWGTIWDADTGQPIAAIPDPAGYSTAGAWSPDGSKVVVGTRYGKITVWDVSEFVQSAVGDEAGAYGER